MELAIETFQECFILHPTYQIYLGSRSPFFQNTLFIAVTSMVANRHFNIIEEWNHFTQLEAKILTTFEIKSKLSNPDYQSWKLF